MKTYYVTIETMFGHRFTEYVDTDKGQEAAKRIAENRGQGKAIAVVDPEEQNTNER